MDSPYAPPDQPLEILHQDTDVLIVVKPSGLLSVPGKGAHLADCMMSRLQKVYPHALLVHRLDRDTSGLMVFALTAHAQRHLSAQFEARKVRKVYVAQVWGKVAEKEGQINLPLKVDWPNRPLQKVDHESGREAITDWKRSRFLGNSTMMRLMPKTGRSHQLRVHMQSLGHPILGDPLYASGAALAAAPRLMLHAEELRFNHPESGKGVGFRAKNSFPALKMEPQSEGKQP